jgi:D-3-phosphoglycerate dehydrogenase
MGHSVLLTDADRFPLTSDQKQLLASGGVYVDEIRYGCSETELISAARYVDGILLYSPKVTRRVIDNLENCRIIARCGAGYDNIDVEAAVARGMVVTYVPDYGIDEVADHTLALILGSVRRVVGIVGFGRIGRAVCMRLHGFGCRVYVSDPFATDEAVASFGAQRVELNELLGTADVITLHVPLAPATRHLLNREAFARMKAGALLVNVSRGELVDEQALVEAMASGRVRGVGLDVLEHEPLPVDSPLRSFPDAVVTPHSAAFSEEALREVSDRAVVEVLRALNGQPPVSPVPVDSRAEWRR